MLAALFESYINILQKCYKGREKYARLQIQWMELIWAIQYEPSIRQDVDKAHAAQCWAALIQSTGLNPSVTTTSVMSC